MDCRKSTPWIAFISPERGSGKTRALEVTEPLVPNPIHAVNVEFRKVGNEEAGLPTILYDEVDTLFGSKVQDTGKCAGCSTPDIDAAPSQADALLSEKK